MDKIRVFTKNLGYGDFLSHKFEQDFTVYDSLSSEFMSEASREMFNEIGQAIGLSLTQARVKVVLKKLSYTMNKAKMNLNEISKEDNGDKILSMNISTDSGVLSAEKVVISLEIPSNKGFFPIMELTLNKPKLSLVKDEYQMSTVVLLKDQGKAFSFKHLNSDFHEIASKLETQPELAKINYERPLVVPEIKISMGPRTVVVAPGKISKIIEKNENSIKDLLVFQLIQLLKTNALGKLVSVIDQYPLDKNYWINTGKMLTQIKIAEINPTEISNVVEALIEGDYCANQNFNNRNKNCESNSKVKTTHVSDAVRRQDMNILMQNENVDLVVSSDEAYINKLIRTTIEAGYWQPLLKSMGVRMGSEQAYVRFNEKGDTANFYMDLIYTLPWFKSKVLGQKEIRFPLSMKVTMRFEKNQDNISQLVIKMVSADISSETLSQGISSENLKSTVGDVIVFQKKVEHLIATSVAPYIGKDMISLVFGQINNVGLESAKLHTEGNGHIMIYLNYDEMGKSSQR